MRVLTNKYSEEDLISGMLEGSGEVIRFVYKKNVAAVKHMVMKFPHIILDTEDVMQEGLSRMILNIREGKFSGKSSVHTYLYSICRNICLKENERVSRDKRVVEEDEYIRNQEGGVFDIGGAEEDDYSEKVKLVVEAKRKLGEPCVEVIDARFGIRDSGSGIGDGGPWEGDKGNGSSHPSKLISFEIVAEQLGISHDNARQRFKRCLEKLIGMVRDSQSILN